MRAWMVVVGAVAGLGLASSAQAAVGLGVQAEGGVQAYTGQLNDALRAGPAWGVDAQLQPKFPVGLELRYQGSSNQLFGSGSIFDGPRAARVVTNGGEALARVSVIPRGPYQLVEPYVAGGVGFSRFSLSDPVSGFKDDTLGSVPVSAGINIHPRIAGDTRLTLGIRGDYKWLFSDQFAPTDKTTDYGVFSKQGGDAYRGEITLGGNF